MGISDHKVLVVDDDPTMIGLLENGLAADHGLYEVLSAGNAQEAMDILERIHVSLVISDIKMPMMSGLDLLAKIRERYPHTHVILMAADASVAMRTQAEKSGCLHFFQKPINIKELRDLIARDLSSPAEGNEGFAGTLSNIQLPDLIQMCCSSTISTAIRVHKGSRVGTIYIEEGEIIHSECQDVEGVEAFYLIFTWRSGSFETLGDLPVKKVTIDKNWQYLLMEGHRRIDEADDDQDEEIKSKASPVSFEEPGGSPSLDDVDDYLGVFRLIPDVEEDEDITAAASEEPVEDLHDDRLRSDLDVIRMVIVDDSSMMSKIITNMLSADKTIEVVGTARNGEDALQLITRLSPDLITLDVNMPIMGGSTALKHIMIKNPCPVVIISALNTHSQSNILDFLKLGAVDFLNKPVRDMDMKVQERRMIRCIRQASYAMVRNFKRPRFSKKAAPSISESGRLEKKGALIVICSGAGGYTELMKILNGLPGIPNACITVIQAMSQLFHRPLSAYLNDISPVRTETVEIKTLMRRNRCYMALNDVPLELAAEKSGYSLNPLQDMDETADMPDHFFVSVTDSFQGHIMVILLSGAETGNGDMLKRIMDKGGTVISQPPSSCIVPRPLEKAVKDGLVSEEADIEEIVKKIVSFT